MTNAREELLEILESKKIKCATISHEKGYGLDAVKKTFLLPVGYTDSQFLAFLESLEFTYNSGYGCQEIAGIVWLQDGAWLERGEYDGSEWWEHKELPEIPDQLKELPCYPLTTKL